MKRQPMARAIIARVEKVLGTGFDPVTEQVLVCELNNLLHEKSSTRQDPPDSAPDAHLEMALEDCNCGWAD